MIKTKPGQINLAFLDTLSCSLGGMIVLFFIFASMTHKGARELTIPDELSTAAVASFASSEGDQMDPYSPSLYVVTGVESCKLVDVDPNVLSYSETNDGFLLFVPHENLDDEVLKSTIPVKVGGCTSDTDVVLKSIQPYRQKDVPATLINEKKLYYYYKDREWSDENR